MMREYHVRICEGLGVQLPGSTRHERRFSRVVHRSVHTPTADVMVRAANVAKCQCTKSLRDSLRRGGLSEYGDNG